jgi:hypothetical protein
MNSDEQASQEGAWLAPGIAPGLGVRLTLT